MESIRDATCGTIPFLDRWPYFVRPAALISSARADVIPSCAVPNGASSMSLQTGAPPVLLRALKEHVGELVRPGGKFDATDVVETGKNRRLIFVWNVGRRWIVAIEHGGYAYNDPILAYDLSRDGRSVTLSEERIGFRQQELHRDCRARFWLPPQQRQSSVLGRFHWSPQAVGYRFSIDTDWLKPASGHEEHRIK